MTAFGIFSKIAKEPTNGDRAQRAKDALTVFTVETSAAICLIR